MSETVPPYAVPGQTSPAMQPTREELAAAVWAWCAADDALEQAEADGATPLGPYQGRCDLAGIALHELAARLPEGR